MPKLFCRSTLKQALLRTNNAMVSQCNLVQQIKRHIMLTCFCNWKHQSTVQGSIVQSSLYWRLVAKSHTFNMETRPMHENTITGAQKNGSRCSGLMIVKVYNSFQVQIWIVYDCNRKKFIEKCLESGTRMSNCRQQWSVMKVPCRFGAAFLDVQLRT